MANLPINLIKSLYYKQKLSTIEIGRRIGVSEWVVLKFMKRVGLTRRTFKEANAVTFGKRKLTFTLRNHLSPREQRLKVAGIMLYWAEGGKASGRNYTMDLANCNANLVKVFLKFLRVICGIDENKLRVQLYCYTNQEVEVLRKYWYKVTEIPLKQFIKPYVRKNSQLIQARQMKYGMVHIRYHDKKLLEKIEKWIEEFYQNNG